jgi:hypothetical protein
MEVWKQIAGYDGMYEVSNLGQVRSFYRSARAPEIPHFLSQGSLRGYRFVHIRRLAGGGYYCPLVHRLVAHAFLEPPTDPGHTVNHKNYDKADNRVENLEWMSQPDNVRHSKDVIPRLRGEQNRSKLTQAQVIQMRERYAVGNMTLKELGKEYGIATNTVWTIISRRKWKHVQ